MCAFFLAEREGFAHRRYCVSPRHAEVATSPQERSVCDCPPVQISLVNHTSLYTKSTPSWCAFWYMAEREGFARRRYCVSPRHADSVDLPQATRVSIETSFVFKSHLISLSTISKNAPKRVRSLIWRRERDLNPRTGISRHTISSRAP